MMSDHDRQMKPLARNLRPPPPPKFVENVLRFKVNVAQCKSPQRARIVAYEPAEPIMFHVQLVENDKELASLQERLKRAGQQLKSLNPSALTTIGTACLVRFENGIFRAAVAREPQKKGDDYLMNLVDYGTTVPVKLENIHAIPTELVHNFPTFALPCRLDGVKKSAQVSNREMVAFFKCLTNNKIINIKFTLVKSDDSSIFCCESISTDKDVNVVNILNNWNPYTIRYPAQSSLESNSKFKVKVSYVDSPSEFFVHLQSPEIQSDYDLMCEELYEAIPQLIVMENPIENSCCAVLLSNELYRGLVISKTSKGLLRVKIVDYGITEELPFKHVFCLPQHLAQKPQFSYECCLSGFESLEVTDNISTQFDIFCGDGRGDRKIFTMTILKSGVKSTVTLEDFTSEPPVNVNNMLLKNSRPLSETIQLENSKKRQRDSKQSPEVGFDTSADPYNRNNKTKNNNASRENTRKIQQTDEKSHRSFFNKTEAQDAAKSINSQSEVKLKEKNRKTNSPNISKDIKVGWVSTIINVNKVFVHFEEHIAGLEKILDEMYAFYENKHKRPLMKDLRVGKMCAARSADSNWYRSKIESISNDVVKVVHCEYGNSETLHKSKLRVLDEKFTKVGDLVVPAYFAIQAKNEKSLLAELKSIFDEGSKEFQFKQIEKFQDGWILEPIDIKSNTNVIEKLITDKKADNISSEQLLIFLKKSKPENNISKNERKNSETQKKSVKTEMKSNSEPTPKPTDKPQYRITAITCATNFFTTLVADASDFQKLHKDIQIIASSMAALDNYTAGTFCLVQQPFDSLYYRAKVIYSDDIVTVQCLDDGKTFSVDKKMLKQMPEALKEKKLFATPSSLCVNVTKHKEEESVGYLMQMMDKVFYGKIVCESGNQTYFDLFDDELNLTDSLISKGLATRAEIIQNGIGFTSHINSVSSFYLQMEFDQLKLDTISKYFESSQNNHKKVAGKAGQIVAALYADDGCWYRARIESKKDDKYTVSFIDYGNVCEVDQIGSIEETVIANLPRMSKHCKLNIPKHVTLPENADEIFKTLCANGATILEVTMIKPGDPIDVDISIDGNNLINLLSKKK